jgi:CheY-like chemotaxis protein
MLLDAVADANAGNTGLRQWSTARVTQRQLAGMRILVVEDNLINQQVADELLSSEGAIVSLAANGRLGVEAVAAAAPQFDVVLMDIQMPVLDGYGATQLIREDLQLLNLPIVAMTANALDSDREACLKAGMNEHVGKPFDMAKLVSLLIRVTGYQASLQSAAMDANPDVAVPALVDIPGLELATALSRMSGMRSLYVRTARDFSTVLATSMDELYGLLRSTDQKTFMMRLHTLKGNAATLGLMDLSRKAAELELLFKTASEPAQCADAMGSLEQLVRTSQEKLALAIAQLAGTEPPKATAQQIEKPSSQLIDAVKELDRLLAASDMEALMRFAEIRDQIANSYAGDFKLLEGAMQGLELEQAHSLCQALLKSWSEA